MDNTFSLRGKGAGPAGLQQQIRQRGCMTGMTEVKKNIQVTDNGNDIYIAYNTLMNGSLDQTHLLTR